jgi:hypothetical protein
MWAHPVSECYRVRVLVHLVSECHRVRVLVHLVSELHLGWELARQAWAWRLESVHRGLAPQVLARPLAWVPPESVQHQVRVPVGQVLGVVALVLIVKAPRARVLDQIVAAQ